MQTLHRSRDRLVGERTALINQLRAVLLERGIVVPQGKRKLEQYLVIMMDEQGGDGAERANAYAGCRRARAMARPRSADRGI